MTAPKISQHHSPCGQYSDAAQAHAALLALYQRETGRLRDAFRAFLAGTLPPGRVRCCYPEVRYETKIHGRVDTRLSFGFVPEPGVYPTTVTRPDLFETYLIEQFTQLLRNHGAPITIGLSDVPIPIHFAFADGLHVEADLTGEMDRDRHIGQADGDRQWHPSTGTGPGLALGLVHGAAR